MIDGIDRSQKKINITDRLIISMDVGTKHELISLCHKINNNVSTLKLGLQLIYSCGIEIVSIVKSFGYRVMLDAKLYDIPNTVSRAAAAITRIGVDKITIHTSGGLQMLKDARDSIRSQAKKMKIIPPLLFGVTILTSLDNEDLDRIGYNKNYMDSVLGLASLADKSKIDGLICSPKEVVKIRKMLGNNLLVATPGVRLKDDDSDDQKRVGTPYDAIKNGADFVIVGRSVTAKENISKNIKKIIDDIKRAL